MSRNHTSPKGILSPIVFLDSLSYGEHSILYENPVSIVECCHSQHVDTALEEIDQALSEGFHAAGFFSYELGYLLEPKLCSLIPENRKIPLIWMGLFREPKQLNHAECRNFIGSRANTDYSVDQLRLTLNRFEYLEAVDRVKSYIEAGDVYQINFTFKYLFELIGNPWSLYADLRRRQRATHAAFIETQDFDILSLSPELFVHTENDNAKVRPMKGTATRGLTSDQDEKHRIWLSTDEKSRAENLMIVDLLRNDLGRVAETGSVKVRELFSVETYPTLHQMTSTVTARLRDDITTSDLIRNLFPCGSITGAPKVRAMEIIRELESTPRGAYSGAIGAFSPIGDTKFNVAIRTLVIDRDGRGELGIGSGIVHDSEPEAEYEECLLKAHFLTKPEKPFQLIETIRWQSKNGYYLLQNHLSRLAKSAQYFGITCDITSIRLALKSLTTEFINDTVRVRLLLDEYGVFSLTHLPTKLPTVDTIFTYAISSHPVDSHDPYLYHKTTNRRLYDDQHAYHSKETGCDEVLFQNERGELTEGSRSNLFVELDGILVTPPITCGLLDGTLRRALLDAADSTIIEQVVKPADLKLATRVYLGNSVMGLIESHHHT